MDVPSDTRKPEADKPYLTSITLGGFQVFDEPTTVPLGKLTFLFGPNSAGKSAIEDGLAIILGMLENKTIYGLATNDDLSRHWRISGQGLVPSITMGITAEIPTNIRACLEVPNEDQGTDCSDPYYAGFGHEVALEFRLSYNDEDDEISNCALFILSLDGVPILELDEGEHVGVNFSHPVLRGFVLSGEYQTLAERFPSLISHRDGWVRIRSNICWFQKGMLDFSSVWYGLEMREPDKEVWKPFEAMLRTAAEETVVFYDAVKGLCIGNMTMIPDIVPASRKIPAARELTFLFNAGDALGDLDLVRASAPQYWRLANSVLAKRSGVEQYFFRMESAGGGYLKTVSARLIDSVNSALSDHLFLERGCAVRADIRVIIPFDDIESLPASDLSHIPSLVHIHLTDSQGRKQAFDQVGSGLGYVLPVLCSVCDDGISISLIQQPELHLHPALQAAIGDVFIEHATDEHQIIIETHSEHLLLRILKRIRQASKGKSPAPELVLRPEDVAVVYFDPRPDGTTKVRRLRISEDGEFLDRWPRGFFTERDSELFDE